MSLFDRRESKFFHGTRHPFEYIFTVLIGRHRLWLRFTINSGLVTTDDDLEIFLRGWFMLLVSQSCHSKPLSGGHEQEGFYALKSLIMPPLRHLMHSSMTSLAFSYKRLLEASSFGALYWRNQH